VNKRGWEYRQWYPYEFLAISIGLVLVITSARAAASPARRLARPHPARAAATRRRRYLRHNESSGDLSVIDAATQQSSPRFPSASARHRGQPGQDHLYVALSGSPPHRPVDEQASATRPHRGRHRRHRYPSTETVKVLERDGSRAGGGHDGTTRLRRQQDAGRASIVDVATGRFSKPSKPVKGQGVSVARCRACLGDLRRMARRSCSI
jgi:hypothetical protein